MNRGFFDRVCLILLVVVPHLISSAARPAIAEDRVWIVAPPIGKTLSPPDRAARDELIKLIADQQAKGTGWNLEVPDRSSGLPAKYEVLLHRSSGCFTDTRACLGIKVDNGEASIERCDITGVYRTKLPAEEIDQLVRRFTYAFHAVEPVKRIESVSSSAIGPAPHYIEVISRDEQSPFQLFPGMMMLDLGFENSPQQKIRDHTFTMLVKYLDELTLRNAKPLAAAEESAEIVRRLKALSPAKPRRQFPSARGRDHAAVMREMDDFILEGNRESVLGVERSLYAELAVQRGIAAALPELKRLNELKLHRRLSIAISPDPKSLIVQAIAEHTRDEELATWAEKFAFDEKHPERLQWLIDVLPRLEADQVESTRGEWICDSLARRKLTKEQLAQLATRFNETKHVRMKVAAASALLQQLNEEPYFTWLVALVRKLPPDANRDSRSPRNVAAEHVFRYSAETGKRRAEAHALLLTLLKEPRQQSTPDSFEMFELVEWLGKLGSAKDLPDLKNLAESESAYLSSYAIKAIASIDPPTAVAQLHRRLARLNQRNVETVDYSHEVYSHFDLILFERDVAAVPLLQTAWKNMKGKRPAWLETSYSPQHVIAFLEAKTGPARAEAAIAHFGDRAHYAERPQMQRLVDQLVAEGADPERCKLLLKVPDETRPGR